MPAERLASGRNPMIARSKPANVGQRFERRVGAAYSPNLQCVVQAEQSAAHVHVFTFDQVAGVQIERPNQSLGRFDRGRERALASDRVEYAREWLQSLPSGG